MTNDFPQSNSFSVLSDDTKALAETVDAWVTTGEIEDDSRAVDAADLLRQVNGHIKDITASRKAVQAPLDEAIASIRAQYNPLLAVMDEAKSAIQRLVDAWLRRKSEAQRMAAAAAAARAAEEARAAREAAENATSVAEIAEAKARGAAAAEHIEQARAAATARVQVGSNFAGERALTIRRGPAKGRIVDLQAACRWAWANRREELAIAVAEICTRAIRGGAGKIPGVEVYREEVVA